MRGSTITTELYCPSCLGLTSHRVKYLAGIVHRVDCGTCGQRWDVGHHWLWHRYLQRLPQRLRSKPARLADEARRQPVTFALGLPSRVVTKPVRIATELGTIVGMFGE